MPSDPTTGPAAPRGAPLGAPRGAPVVRFATIPQPFSRKGVASNDSIRFGKRRGRQWACVRARRGKRSKGECRIVKEHEGGVFAQHRNHGQRREGDGGGARGGLSAPTSLSMNLGIGRSGSHFLFRGIRRRVARPGRSGSTQHVAPIHRTALFSCMDGHNADTSGVEKVEGQMNSRRDDATAFGSTQATTGGNSPFEQRRREFIGQPR